MNKSNKSKKNKRYGFKKARQSEPEEIASKTDLYSSLDSSPGTSFSDFPLSHKTLDGLTKAGYNDPTEIQRDALGIALQGSDVLGAAKTGSGKTLAFLIPILECLWRKEWTSLDGLGVLIISPTRELAYQTFQVLRKIGNKHEFSAALVVGGSGWEFEKKRLAGTNIVICTPGRLLQHMDENPQFNCDNLQMLILDEADRILDLGFEQQLNAIVENLPTERQTMLFSATQTKSVKDLARLSLRDPVYISVHENATHSTPESLVQSKIVCEEHEKMNVLWSFLRNHIHKKILVFLTTCKQVRFYDEVIRKLRPGKSVMALYGTMNPAKRMDVYEKFCHNKSAALLATDVAARGLDFPAVDWVVQLDCPADAQEYIHRSGRTARYNRKGESLLILTPSQDEGMTMQLKDNKVPIQEIEVNRNKMENIGKKVDSLCAQFPQLKEFAQKAFVSYIRSIFLMRNKSVFKVDSIDLPLLSRSFGLAITPRVRFLRKHQKTEKLGDEDTIGAKNSKIGAKTNKSGAKNTTDDLKTVERSAFDVDDDDIPDDIFSVKKEDVFNLRSTNPDEIPEIASDVDEPISKKKLSRAALAKKLLKKNIRVNKKMVFGEEAEEPSERNDNGLDIEEAKRSLAEQDIEDRKNFRERLKDKRRERKRKLMEKEGKVKMRKKDDMVSDDDESIDLSWLPDPDKKPPTADSSSPRGEEEGEEEAYVDQDEDMALALIDS